MSMNFSEFSKLMGADPLNKEAETLQARASGPEFEACAAEAEQFEAKLDASLSVNIDSEALINDILAIPDQPEESSNMRWFAMAASLVLEEASFTP